MPVFGQIAQGLADRGVSPNLISVGSVVAAMLGLVMMFGAVELGGIAGRLLLVAAAGMVQFRLICNLLDGMVAECGGQASMVGKLYNEAPDRISDLLLLVGFGLLGQSPHALFLGALAGAMAVLTAYVRGMSSEIGARPSFTGPMAKPQRMAVLTAGLLALAVLPAGWVTRWWGGRDGGGLVEAVLVLVVLGCAFTAWRRWRGLVAYARCHDREARR